MSIETLIAVVSASAALVTIVLSIIGSSRLERKAADAARARSVLEALTRMEAVAVTMRKFAWQRLGHSVELDFLLASFRLLASLDGKDRPVGLWIGGEAARLELAPSDEEAYKRGVRLVTKVVEWHTGNLPTSWFQNQLEGLALPTVDEKRSAKRTRTATRTKRMVVELGAFVVISACLRWIWIQTSPAELVRAFDPLRVKP